ncbi:hypothetical protein DPMN_143647 [Dreissena polymorpha]|uniref:Uncharacterized protein n=1 Tax=Dreissena polymorpha TaxID=45954 RepID=A0A9D4GGL3_DREPO|nr:hypothetical protein DPMN_143647 [Dreissena polymorpha]
MVFRQNLQPPSSQPDLHVTTSNTFHACKLQDNLVIAITKNIFSGRPKITIFADAMHDFHRNLIMAYVLYNAWIWFFVIIYNHPAANQI